MGSLLRKIKKKRISLNPKQNMWQWLVYSAAAVLLAILISCVFLELFGFSAWEALRGLVEGSVGSLSAIDNTLFMATPILCTGLSVAIAMKSGLFNIGVEGQLYFGAFAAAVIGVYCGDLPPVIAIPAVLIGGACAGSILAAVVAALKNWFGAHEVITTIMLNSIAIEFTSYLVNYKFQAESGLAPQSPPIGPGAVLAPLFKGYQVSGVLFITICLLVIYTIIMYRSKLGFEIRAVGENIHAAEVAGINPYRTRMLAMLLSGAFAGLAGAGEVIGHFGRFIDRFSPGYGFDGMTVAFLGQGMPLGILVGSLVIGGIRAAGTHLDLFTKIPVDFVVLIQGLIILIITAPKLIEGIGNLRKGVWRRG